MITGVLLRHTRDRLASLRQLVAPDTIEGPFALSPEDYEDLVTLVLDFPNSYKEVVDSELRRVFTERDRDVRRLQIVRSDLEKMADHYTAMVQVVEADTTLRTLATTHSLFRPTLTKLEEAVALLQGDKKRLVEMWPVCSAEELAEAALPTGREHFLPVDEAFAQMKGIPVAELHRQLEDHKAKRKTYGWE